MFTEQKHGKVDQENNMFKIQFMIGAAFYILIKSQPKNFVNKNIKPSWPLLGLFLCKLEWNFQEFKNNT